jgi:uncharacterized Fe-S radical SAM superfamily protein PflX
MLSLADTFLTTKSVCLSGSTALMNAELSRKNDGAKSIARNWLVRHLALLAFMVCCLPVALLWIYEECRRSSRWATPSTVRRS